MRLVGRRPNEPAAMSGSVRGIFDEIIVVDTNGVDRTREIDRPSYGSRMGLDHRPIVRKSSHS